MVRHLAGSSLRFLACALALAVTRPLAAQEPPRVVVSGGDKIAFSTSAAPPISDDVIRTLIQAHHADELQQSEPRSITLVIDANDQYVTSKVSKTTLITGEGNGTSFVFGDSTGANAGPVVIRRTTSGDATGAASATSFSVMTSSSSDGGSGLFGTGYSFSDIGSVSLRRFAAGQLGTGTIVVPVIKLK